MVLAVIWHYWLGVLLVLGGIAFVVATVAGYFYKVTRMRYPSKDQRR
jgi:hypothetical protein